MKRKLKAGSTSVSVPIFVSDSSSTTGAGLAIAHNTAGLVAEYRRAGQSSWTAITLVTKTLGTYTSGGLIADGSLTGAHELDIPNAVLATGAAWAAVRLRGATNMVPVLIEIELDAIDYQDGAAAGLTKLADIETDTQDIQARLPAALVSGRIDAYTGAVSAGAVTTIQAGLALASDLAIVAGYLDTEITELLADVADVQSRLPAALVGGRIDAYTGAVSAGAVTTIQAGLALASDLAIVASYIDTEIADLAATLVDIQGPTWSNTTDTLEAIRNAISAIPGGGGGGGTVIVGPLVSSQLQTAAPGLIRRHQYDTSAIGPIRVEDSQGSAVDLAAWSDLEFVVESLQGEVLAYVGEDAITKSSSGGPELDQYTVEPSAAMVANYGKCRYALRRPPGTTEQALDAGEFTVIRTARRAPG